MMMPTVARADRPRTMSCTPSARVFIGGSRHPCYSLALTEHQETALKDVRF
jgi:hypothetical protein